MPTYYPPLRTMQFVMHEVLQVQQTWRAIPSYADLDADIVGAILEEAGTWTKNVLAPLNTIGDREGCVLDSAAHTVKTPSGFKSAYTQFCENGWPALACDPAYGGQGLPYSVNQTVYEMLNSANQAWTMYPGLTHGAYACIHEHGSDTQKTLYLPHLVKGTWTGTMCLTEPHCGTDLGLLRTKATPQEDGTYALTGQKIFISSGEHDLSENIVHLVLARLPDAPSGSKGISLFIVPKFKVSSDGSLGSRNTIMCTGLEHKMGIHGNSTCQMTLDGAIGELVGQPHKGLQAMFVMMNAARIGVGVQSLGLTEIAYQNASLYAKDRVQMRSLSGAAYPEKTADPIVVHPDVRRMLLTGRAYALGARLLTTYCANLLDIEHAHPEPDLRQDAHGELALLTPIVKAFITDNAWQSTSEALQVFGGHGYISEWGMEQFVRDSRINMIYEGTNGVQALDFLGRKVLSDMGKQLRTFGEKIRDSIDTYGTDAALSEFVDPLSKTAHDFNEISMALGLRAMQSPALVGAASTPYLRYAGHLVYGWLFLQAAAVCVKHSGDPFYDDTLAVIRFYFARILPETRTLKALIQADAATLMTIPDERM